ACRDLLVVDVGIVSRAIGVEGDRRIGALRLRNAASYLELSPRGAGICANGSALLAPALVNRQPDSPIGRHVKMAMETSAIGATGRGAALAVVSHNSRTITCT